ncbi:MAG: diguanylate cyclase [Candidatus Riflebacteria bacterium]|nr:diguanylate cyclase [Candidatus Riflebacteria bacterium]
MKKLKNENLNLYLFSNLILVVFLVFGIWKGDFWQDTTVKLPGILAFLVIINTFLIFRETFKTSFSPSESASSGPPSGKFSLCSLRKLISERSNVDYSLLNDILSEFLGMTRDESSALFIAEEKGGFTMIASAGPLSTQITSSRFYLSEGYVILKYPGGLGEEKLFKWDSILTSTVFFSGITHLRARIIPLKGITDIRGFWMAITTPNSRKIAKFDREWLALYLEGILSLVCVQAKSAGNLMVDSKTGLMKYEGFKLTFETEIERSERYGQNMTLMYLKVSNFSNFSPAVKDRVQLAVAASLRDSLRKLDLMFLWDKPGVYAAILTETTPEVAKMVAQRIVSAFRKHISTAIKEMGEFPELSLNAGTATYPCDSSHGTGLADKASDALETAIRKEVPFIAFGEIISTPGEF